MCQTTFFTLKILIQNKKGKDNKSYPLLGLKQLPGLVQMKLFYRSTIKRNEDIANTQLDKIPLICLVEVNFSTETQKT